jgi:hypothetical protein
MASCSVGATWNDSESGRARVNKLSENLQDVSLSPRFSFSSTDTQNATTFCSSNFDTAATHNMAFNARHAQLNANLATVGISEFAELPRGVINDITRMYDDLDTSYIKVPREWARHNLREFAFTKVGYKKFVHGMDQANGAKPIDRLRMEAVWWKQLVIRYATFDPRSKS